MTLGNADPSVIEFLIRLRKIEKANLSIRDVVFLYVIMRNPGINGQDASDMMGIVNRSGIQKSLHKMIRIGLIEDRREKAAKAQSCKLHALQPAFDFWEKLIKE